MPVRSPDLASAVAVALAAGALVLVPSAATAAGGNSIAAAVPITYGQEEVGGGQGYGEFWRMPVTMGDLVTFDVDVATDGSDSWTDFRPLPPATNDYTLSSDTDDGLGEMPGKHQLTWTAPSSGDWILWVSLWRNFNNDNGGPSPYTFIATIAHATTLKLTAPTLAKRGSTVTVRGTVTSPAGVPQGSCLIAGHPAPVSSAGICFGHVRVGTTSRSVVSVSFVANDGWQDATAKRSIRLYR
jgi:hypothetical protein